jgi:hypothetical protein
MPDRSRIIGIVDIEPVALQMAKAKDDMRQLVRRETIYRRIPARIITDHGQPLGVDRKAHKHKEKKKKAAS